MLHLKYSILNKNSPKIKCNLTNYTMINTEIQAIFQKIKLTVCK